MNLAYVLYRLVLKSETSLPPDVRRALAKAKKTEKNPLARAQLGLILKNVSLAEGKKIPVCQDTGLPTFYVTLGGKNYSAKKIEDAIRESVRLATKRIPLRPNVVNPFDRKNTGDNTGIRVPVVYYEFEPKARDDFLEVVFVPKGGGCENASALAMLNPFDGIRGIEKFVLEHVVKIGGKPCPPYVLGIGVGGSADLAVQLAKKASLRNIEERNGDARVARIERALLRKINSLGIGTMGLGGSTTCLAVNIEYADTHTASLPVALSLMCWASRRAGVRIIGNKVIWA
ncbi:MAG: fumarate hydratase [Candidatus Micrarchaeota archaeon]